MMIRMRFRGRSSLRAGKRPSRTTVAVLRALLSANGMDVEMSAWGLAKATHRPGPLVYNALERLEGAGWITGRWEHQPLIVSHLPRSRLYSLTPTGVEEARRVITACRPSS